MELITANNSEMHGVDSLIILPLHSSAATLH